MSIKSRKNVDTGSTSSPCSSTTTNGNDAVVPERTAQIRGSCLPPSNNAWRTSSTASTSAPAHDRGLRWCSQQDTVRRDWLAGFLTRKSAPKGAESLICEAVLTGNYTLSKAMDHRHPMLFKLLGIDVPSGYYGAGYEECQKIATKATTPKGATMTVLAAVLAAWEDSTGKQTWRNPTGWDARVLGALAEWGYEPSDVERLLLGDQKADSDAA